jgi:uracil-DNA glycosylase
MNARGRVFAAAFLPEGRSLASLRVAAAHCRGCDLHRDATQTVGEEPGDAEHRAGHPFVDDPSLGHFTRGRSRISACRLHRARHPPASRR